MRGRVSEMLQRSGGAGADGRDELVRPYLGAPVTGVAVSTLGRAFGSETLNASSDAAARADEIQLDLGDGPLWRAFHTREPVLRPDLRRGADEWPAVTAALLAAGVAAVFAFPLSIGALDVGCVSLYADHPHELSPERVSAVRSQALSTAHRVLEAAVLRAATERPGEWDAGRYSRREVHQAAGMVAAQVGTTPDDALLLLRAAAFAAGRSVLELSADVLDRVVDFTDPGRPDTQRGTGHE